MTDPKIPYDDAVREIEEILLNIESGDLGVDELADKVTRVSFLLKHCRERLRSTEEQIDRILGEEGERDPDAEAG